MEVEAELMSFLDSGPAAKSLAEFNVMLVQIVEEIERKLYSPAGGNANSDEDLARLLQQQMNLEERKKEAEEAEKLLLQFLKQDNTCDFCHAEYERASAAASEIHVLGNCEHRICRNCAVTEIIQRKQPKKQSEYVCPLAKCSIRISEGDAKALFPKDCVDRFIDSALSDFESLLIKCPAGCGWAVTVDLSSNADKTTSTQGELGPDGKPLSEEARKHRDRFRIRCRRCPDTDFCAECLIKPYHLGFTCSAHAHFKAQRHCRFCGAEVPKEAQWLIDLGSKKTTVTVKILCNVLAARHANYKPKSKLDILKQQVLDTEPLANLCASPECQEWAAKGCNQILPCRHVCIGVRDETSCIGCLQCPPAATKRLLSGTGAEVTGRGDDLCNICWVDELKAAPCLLLDCGHVFHQHCVEKKIAQRWCGARITFTFLDCPLCKKQLGAPALTSIIAPFLELKTAVLNKAEQRLAIEGGHKEAAELQPGGRYHKDAVQYALHKFAYYLCSKCRSPYFGGHRSCEVAAGEGEARNFDESEMVCGGCSALGKAACEKHGVEAIEYKCKFCCAVASWFCWGTTHFCDSCHRKQGTPESMSKKPRDQLPKCTPATCPLRVAHPPNGEEYVLGCQICRSATSV